MWSERSVMSTKTRTKLNFLGPRALHFINPRCTAQRGLQYLKFMFSSLPKNAATRIHGREHPCYQKTPPLGYMAENTPAIKKSRHSDIWQRTPLLSKNATTRIYGREHHCYQKTPPLGYRAENTPAIKIMSHSHI